MTKTRRTRTKRAARRRTRTVGAARRKARRGTVGMTTTTASRPTGMQRSSAQTSLLQRLELLELLGRWRPEAPSGAPRPSVWRAATVT